MHVPHVHLPFFFSFQPSKRPVLFQQCQCQISSNWACQVEAKRRRWRVCGAAGGWLVLWKKSTGVFWVNFKRKAKPRQFFKDKLFGGKETKLSQMASKHQVGREVRCHDGGPPKKKDVDLQTRQIFDWKSSGIPPRTGSIGSTIWNWPVFVGFFSCNERRKKCFFLFSYWGFLPFCPLKVHLFLGGEVIWTFQQKKGCQMVKFLFAGCEKIHHALGWKYRKAARLESVGKKHGNNQVPGRFNIPPGWRSPTTIWKGDVSPSVGFPWDMMGTSREKTQQSSGHTKKKCFRWVGFCNHLVCVGC